MTANALAHAVCCCLYCIAETSLYALMFTHFNFCRTNKGFTFIHSCSHSSILCPPQVRSHQPSTEYSANFADR